MSKIIGYDFDGEEVISKALMEIINQYPGLDNGDEIKYAVLADASGKAIFPTSGSAITQEIVDVTGHVTQSCDYPFIMIYRASGLTSARKEKVKEWLDNFGRWLERQPIVINNIEYQLKLHPALTRGRKFKQIRRTSVAFLDSVNSDNAENWAINITATYEFEFDR